MPQGNSAVYWVECIIFSKNLSSISQSFLSITNRVAFGLTCNLDAFNLLTENAAAWLQARSSSTREQGRR